MERVKRVRTEEGKRGREGEGVCCEAMCMFYVWVERRGREGGRAMAGIAAFSKQRVSDLSTATSKLRRGYAWQMI